MEEGISTRRMNRKKFQGVAGAVARVQWVLEDSLSQALKSATFTEAKAGQTSTWKPYFLP